MANRLGRQTPTQSVVLPYKATKGDQAIRLYELTGRKAQEWQKSLVRDIMARNEDGLWTHTRFGYAVPRRNGKSEIAYIREIWGLVFGEKILHTAHRTTTTHKAHEKLYSLIVNAGIPIKNSIRAYGREKIILSGGGSVEFRTRTAKGGLGEGFDLLIVDEAQEYQTDQESALKYIVTDSKNGQTIMMGTPPTAVSAGTVFKNLRSNVFKGEAPNTGWAEWSVESLCDPFERENWYQTNPSLGTIFTERDVLTEITGDDVDFNIQRLGLWLSYDQKSAISEAEWMELKAQRMPKLIGDLSIGIKYGKDGTNVAVSVAVKTASKKTFVEAIGCRNVRDGDEWILDFLRKTKWNRAVIDGAGGQQLLAGDMKQLRMRKPILPTTKEVIIANANFEQAIFDKRICHKGQESLKNVVSNCEKRPIGSNGGFGYKALKEGYEIALLDSIMLALWASDTAKEAKPQRISY